jgi:predicted nucleotidyltransferase
MDAGLDIAAAARMLLAKEQRRREHNRRLFERASADCAQIVEMAVRDFKPRRVLQWGSLLEPDGFDERSDMDIAVEGLARARHLLDLLGRALHMTDFRVDLVELGNLDPKNRESLLRRAKAVYEREQRTSRASGRACQDSQRRGGVAGASPAIPF